MRASFALITDNCASRTLSAAFWMRDGLAPALIELRSRVSILSNRASLLTGSECGVTHSGILVCVTALLASQISLSEKTNYDCGGKKTEQHHFPRKRFLGG